MNDKLLEGLSEQFSKVMGGLNSGSGELPGQAQVKQVLQSALSRMDLVTRDEFDAQAAVLQRTRAKVEALEARLDALEAQLNAE